MCQERRRSATATGAAARLRALFVVAEFALALVLLVGAALIDAGDTLAAPVTPGYFDTLRIPLLGGRLLSDPSSLKDPE